MRMDRAYEIAWTLAPRLPEPLVRGLFDAVFVVAARRGGKGVSRLRENYRRLRPEATDAELERLARQGMREYGRYWAEAFMLPRLSPDQIRRRVRVVAGARALKDMRSGSTVLALGHCGNWDLAGAWVSQNLAPILTVAERLKPERLFEEFVEFRQSLGMEVIALDAGQNVFGRLAERARQHHRIVALLADRDLTHRGLAVTLAGEEARAAAGPAALALTLDAPLYFTGIRSVRIGRGWGIELEFRGPLTVPEGAPDRVAALTQAWVNELTAYVTRYPTAWHMMQRVFAADLDPARGHP